MKKLRLDLDALSVESFEIAAEDGRGTVAGRSEEDQDNVSQTKFGTSCLYGTCWMTCTSCNTYAPVMGACVLSACTQPECGFAA